MVLRSLTDVSTGLSAGSTSTDDFSGCLVDGCYEISGISGSTGYSFAYTLNGGDMVIPGNASETGTILFRLVNQDVLHLQDVLILQLITTVKFMLFQIILFASIL